MRYIRDTVVYGKIETTYGTDSVPTGGANAMQVSNVRITPLNAQYVSRDLIRNYFGVSDQLLSSYNKLISFDIEAVGSGALGVAPAWGVPLRCCGWAETAVTDERVYYKPVTNGQESGSFYCYDSGVLHKFLGARGAAAISMALGSIPKISYAMVAIDGGDTTATPSGVDFSDFRVPEAITDQFTSDLTLGCTLVADGDPVGLTGGTVYPSAGIEIDTGVRAEYIPLLGQQSVEITDRAVKGKVRLAATAAQEVAFYAAIKAATRYGIGLLHGTVEGDRFGIFGPAGQIVMPNKDEIQGKRLMGYDFNFVPVAGNDELVIVTSF